MRNYWATIPKEEKANVLTHLIGIPINLFAIAYFSSKVSLPAAPRVYWGLVLYFFILVFLYVVSTTYHAVMEPILKHRLRILDHITIYFMIAGTHTPLILTYLPNTYGYSCLAILWTIVLIGTVFKLFFVGRFEFLSVTLYVLLGWSALATVPYMTEQLPPNVLFWLLVGAFFYMFGIIFYALERIPYNHAVWHLFVLGGSTGHFMAILSCFV